MERHPNQPAAQLRLTLLRRPDLETALHRRCLEVSSLIAAPPALRKTRSHGEPVLGLREGVGARPV